MEGHFGAHRRDERGREHDRRARPFELERSEHHGWLARGRLTYRISAAVDRELGGGARAVNGRPCTPPTPPRRGSLTASGILPGAERRMACTLAKRSVERTTWWQRR